jgi:WD40 repeat protein/mono/diheme cytochrome c family protein
MRPLCRLTLSALLAAVAAHAAEPSFSRDIRPILQRACQGCHQPNLKTSDLDLTTYSGLAAGGKRGPGLKLLLPYVTGEMKPQMPIGQPPLAPEQIAVLRDWIAAGARDDTPSTAAPAETPVSYLQPPVITALAYSPDGSHLAVSAYREVVLIPAGGDQPAKRLTGLSERVHALAFSGDGKRLVVAGGTPARFGEVQVWDTAAAKMLRSVTLTGDTLFGGSLSPDGKVIAVGATDNTVRLLDTDSGKELHKIGNHENWVLGTVFGRDGKRVVSVGRDRAAKLTETATGAFLENINLLRGELTAVARHPHKEIVVIGGEERIPYVYLMDRPKNMKIADDTTMIRKLDRQEGAIFAFAWSPDGSKIAVAGAGPAVNVYDAESGKLVAALTGHKAGIYALAWSPDSQSLATGGFDGTVRIYRDGKLAREFVPVPLKQKAGVHRKGAHV